MRHLKPRLNENVWETSSARFHKLSGLFEKIQNDLKFKTFACDDFHHSFLSFTAKNLKFSLFVVLSCCNWGARALIFLYLWFSFWNSTSETFKEILWEFSLIVTTACDVKTTQLAARLSRELQQRVFVGF